MMPIASSEMSANAPVTPKNILITGASGGIGTALAHLYATDKNTHLILLARNAAKLKTLAKRCEQLGAAASFHVIDVTQRQHLQDLITDIDNQHPIDLIICNAGVTSHIGAQGEAENWDAICRVIDTNLYGVLASLNPLISRMQTRQQGQIAIISSLGAYRGMPITPAYCASKAAVKAYGEALRGWLVNDNIQVNVICPGFVKSDMSDHFPGDKPLMISADKAARKIKRGLEKNKANLSFPFPLNLGMWFLMVLPAPLSDWFMRRFDYGGRR